MKYTITIEIETDSASPEEWITESILQQLEEGEQLTSVTVESN